MRKIILCGMCLISTMSVWANESANSSGSFISIVKDSGMVGVIIWLMLFATSLVTCWLIIDAAINVRPSKQCPPDLLGEVQQNLGEGNVNGVMAACNKNNSAFSDVVKAFFEKLPKGYDTMLDAAGAALEEKEEKLNQKISYLNLCGSVAPMLGLLGTVTGMVSAFFTLGSATGVEKAQLLALAISQALYTTAAGLIISVPALVAYNIFKNKATNIIMHTEKHATLLAEEVKERL